MVEFPLPVTIGHILYSCWSLVAFPADAGLSWMSHGPSRKSVCVDFWSRTSHIKDFRASSNAHVRSFVIRCAKLSDATDDVQIVHQQHLSVSQLGRFSERRWDFPGGARKGTLRDGTEQGIPFKLFSRSGRTHFQRQQKRAMSSDQFPGLSDIQYRWYLKNSATHACAVGTWGSCTCPATSNHLA